MFVAEVVIDLIGSVRQCYLERPGLDLHAWQSSVDHIICLGSKELYSGDLELQDLFLCFNINNGWDNLRI
jgi:hypothetical protein